MASDNTASPGAAPPTYSLAELIRYFLLLGTTGFGGPIALVGYMHRDLVEEKGWISEDGYQEGLTLAQVAPGPLAAQLSFYMGYIHYGLLGSALVGLAFVLPSFLMVVALGWAYTSYGGLNWMQGAFYGVGAAVIGIIAISAYKLTNKTIGRDWWLWAVYLVNAASTVITESERIDFILLGGALIWLVRTPPTQLWNRNRLNGLSALPLLPLLAAVPAVTCWIAQQDLLVLCHRRRVCLWQWSGDYSLPLWRCGQELSVAGYAAVPRCCCGGDDHAGSCGDHHGLHRFSGGWFSWSLRGTQWRCSFPAICSP